jgi:hypothetical protein
VFVIPGLVVGLVVGPGPRSAVLSAPPLEVSVVVEVTGGVEVRLRTEVYEEEE